jgi:hypothetical protein
MATQGGRNCEHVWNQNLAAPLAPQHAYDPLFAVPCHNPMIAKNGDINSYFKPDIARRIDRLLGHG